MSNIYIKYRDANYDRSALLNEKKVTIFLCGISNILSKMSLDKQKEFTAALSMIKDTGLYHLVIIDNADKIKQQLYENWFKTSIDNSNGVWLGSGVLDQYALKLSLNPRELRGELGKAFAVIVIKGKPYIIKYIGGIDDEF
jgi:S-DNA-T family DNA segregation ATPase FtsK/SpoIIIE